MSALTHRGWEISPAFIGWHATHPDYDASYEGPEDGWVDNGMSVHGLTLRDVRQEVDCWIDEHAGEARL